MAGNSKVNGNKWPEFKLVRDFMAVMVTCKFDDNTIKSEGAIISLWGKKFGTQGQVTPKRIVQSGQEGLIKTEGAIVPTTFFPALSGR